MLGRELLVTAGQGQRLGRLDGLFGAVGIEFEIHNGPLIRRISPATPFQEATTRVCETEMVWRMRHTRGRQAEICAARAGRQPPDGPVEKSNCSG